MEIKGINKIKAGRVFKNYRELCKELGLEIKSGKSKRLQLENLERYFTFHKEGNKIVIDSVKLEVREKVDKRGLGNNNNLSKNLRYMILDLASRHPLKEGGSVGFSKTFVYKYCGMINDNYRYARDNRKQFSECVNISQLAVDECLEYTDDRLSKYLRVACSTLTNTNKALGFRFGYNYIISGGPNDLDTHYTADISTEDIIRETENKIMKQMKISRYETIYKYGRWREFKNLVMKKLREEHSSRFFGIKYYYNAIVFNYLNQTVDRTKKGFEEDFGLDRETAKLNVNKYFSKSLDGTIDRRHKSTVKKYIDNPDDASDIEKYRMSNTYTKEQKKAKNTIIKTKHEQLKFNIDSADNDGNEEIPF